MSEITVFNEIVVRQIEGVMMHTDLADIFDFKRIDKCFKH